MNKIINRIKSIKKLEYILLAIIIILGFVARLYKINSPLADWHSWRQADTASVTKTFVKEGINILYPRYQDISSIQTGFQNPIGYRFVEVPIFNAVHAFLFKAVAKIPLEVWGRLVSVFSALISSYFIFLIGRRYLGKWGGVLSSFFFLFIPFNIYFTRVILPEPMATMFALGAIWFFIRYIDSGKDINLLPSGILFALSILIKPFTLFYTPALFYILFEKYPLKELIRNKKVLIPLIVYSLIIFIPFIGWRIWIGRHPEGIPFYTWMFNGDKIRFRPAFWRWIFGERIGKLILGVWGLIPFAFGILSSKKKNYFNLFLFFGVILYTIVVATANVRHDYYQIFLIPAISLILAQGSIYLWENIIFNKWISRTILLFSVVMMLGMATYQIKDNYLIIHPEIIEAGKAVQRLTPANALIIAPYNGDTAFLYQTDRWGWPAIDSSILEIIQRGASYFVSVNFSDKDTQDAMKEYTTIEKTDKYLVLDLLKPIKTQK